MTRDCNAVARTQNISNSLQKPAIDLICFNTLDKINLVSDCKNDTKCYRTHSVYFGSDLSSPLPLYELHTIITMNEFHLEAIASTQNHVPNETILGEKVWYGLGIDTSN